MTLPADESAPGRLTGVQPAVQWGLMAVASGVLAVVFEWLHLPAALLLAGLIGGILVGTNGGSIKVPPWPYLAGQSIVGAMVAGAISADIVMTVVEGWPLFLGMVGAILAASSFLGWLMSRLGVLPGSTAVWGTAPGAATPMMLMAQAHGADARLVAFMQYLRVVFVAMTAAVMARFWLAGPDGGAAHVVVWFPPIHWLAFLQTLALAAACGLLARRFRIPAGGFIVPLAVGSVLHVLGLIEIFLPEWLLAASYMLMGWAIGLSFSRRIILHAFRVLPQVALSTAALIAFCGGLAWLLHVTMGIDPLTAYLATSPGGMDSVAIIAATTKVDVPFVMALQTLRFVVILAIGPWIARAVARSLRPRA